MVWGELKAHPEVLYGAVAALDHSADVAALAARSEALCDRRPLYPGFGGYATFLAERG